MGREKCCFFLFWCQTTNSPIKDKNRYKSSHF